jgi:hypothetical protein
VLCGQLQLSGHGRQQPAAPPQSTGHGGHTRSGSEDARRAWTRGTDGAAHAGHNTPPHCTHYTTRQRPPQQNNNNTVSIYIFYYTDEAHTDIQIVVKYRHTDTRHTQHSHDTNKRKRRQETHEHERMHEHMRAFRARQSGQPRGKERAAARARRRSGVAAAADCGALWALEWPALITCPQYHKLQWDSERRFSLPLLPPFQTHLSSQVPFLSLQALHFSSVGRH